jgi:hypothetical protein
MYIINNIKSIIHKYKTKSIEQILENKLQEFSKLFPEYMQKDILKHCYLAGGCIYRLYNKTKPKDWDIFCEDDWILSSMQAHLMSSDGSNFESVLDKVKRYEIYSSGNKIFTNYATTIGNFQIVHKFHGSPEYVVGQFDFKHNMFYYKEGKVHCVSDFKYIKDKQLHFNFERARDIAGVLLRIPKFIERGMWISKKDHALILEKLDKTDEGELAIIEKYVKGLGY